MKSKGAIVLGLALLATLFSLPKQDTRLKFFYEPEPGRDYQLIDWTPYEGRSTINADSLNERFDYAFEKQAGVYQIVALGGTSTYGLYVNTEDNWTERLVEEGELYPSWRRALADMQQILTEKEMLFLQKSYLAEFNQYYQGPLLIVVFPRSRYKDLLENFANARPHTYYYAGLADLDEIPDAVFPKDEHPNEKGHKIIAEDILKYLDKSQIIPCDSL